MKKHDIVLVDFPFSDLSSSKLRPAVVVASPGGQNLILCQITTKKRSINNYEVQLPKAATEGDIRFDSNIYVDMLFTLHENLIKKPLGRITDPATRRKLESALKKLFT